MPIEPNDKAEDIPRPCEGCVRVAASVELEADLAKAAGDVVSRVLLQDQHSALDEIAREMIDRGLLPMIGEENDPTRFDVLEDIGYWRAWIQGQARLLWMYRGAPWGQDSVRQMDDFMRAKRYFAYLLAEHLLWSCICRKTATCPLGRISSNFARYLQSITVHQLAQFRAYFKRLHESAPSTEVAEGDYLEAIDYIDKAFNANCSPERWQQCVAWTDPPSQSQWERIKTAKKNIIRLMEPDAALEADIGRYVDSFYDWLANIKTNQATSSVGQRLLGYLYKDTHIVSVFEVLVKCFLARATDAATHNAIRAQLKKYPIVASPF